MKKLILKFAFLLALSLTFTSCEKDEGEKTVLPGEEGFFIVNEGNFNQANTTLSYFDKTTNSISNDIFYNANKRDLGDQAQSMTISNGLGYIVVQNSKKIEVIDTETYKSLTTITEGIESPRYFTALNSEKGYVSDWGKEGTEGFVKVIDLTTNTVTKTIETASGSNQMLLVDMKLWVANSKDKTISVINTSTDTVEKTLTVGDNPDSLTKDSNGNIWLACKGNTIYNEDWSVNTEDSSAASIIKLSSLGKIEKTFGYTTKGTSASNISINNDGDKLYYLYGGQIQELSINATELPSSSFSENFYYGVSVNPSTGNILGFSAGDYTAAGSFDIFSSEGIFLESHTVGIIPNGAVFK